MRALSRRDAVKFGAGLLPFAGFAAAGRARADDKNNSPEHKPIDMDMCMAGCLLSQGHRQIEVCRFALDRVQNADCKKFCQGEIHKQEELKTKLARLGYECPTKISDNRVVRASGTSDSDIRDRTAITVGTKNQLPAAIAKMVALEMEVLEQCISTTKSELGKKQGQQLDMCFIGDQYHCHLAQYDHVVVYKKHAGKELARVFEECQSTIERDLQQCRSIMETMMHKA